MAYRFPGDGPFTGKKGHEAHARDYGDAAGEAYHEVRQRFFPEEIDEVDLLSGAFQLLAQGDPAVLPVIPAEKAG